MKRMRKIVSVMTSLVILLTVCLPAMAAGNESEKEEVVYVNLTSAGQVDAAYVVNIFPGGAVTDYGDYTSVRMMNTQDKLNYSGGLVTFVSNESRVYYQGNLSRVDLPWLFDITWTLNGQQCTADQMAGATGKMAMTLSVRKNPNCTGDFFDTHALQIAASLDTKQCSDIVADGATQANVGSVRQLNWIVLPGTETDVTMSATVRDFEMTALSINGVRMQLDPGEEIVDDVLDLVDGLEELRGHNEELTDGAREIVQSVLDSANEELQGSAADFQRLGITLNTLTIENYAEEIERLQSEILDKVDDYVLQQAEMELRRQVNQAAEALVRQEVEKAARVQVEEEVYKVAEQQVREAVIAEARRQVEEAVRNPTDENIEILVEMQMQTDEVQAMIDATVEAQMATAEVQAQIDAELEAAVRPQVEAVVEAEIRSQVEAAMRQVIRQGIEKAVEAKIRAQVIEEETSGVLPGDMPELPEMPDISDIISALPTPGESLPEAPDLDGEWPDLEEALKDLENKLPDLDSLLPDVKDKLPDGGSLLPDAGDTLPDVGSLLPDAGSLLPDAGSLLPDAGSLLPDAGDTLPDAGSLLPDAGSLLPDAGSLLPDAGDTLPGSGSLFPDLWGSLVNLFPTTTPSVTPENDTAQPTVAPDQSSSFLPDFGSLLENLPTLDFSTMEPIIIYDTEENSSTQTDLISWLIPTARAEEYCLTPAMEEKVAQRLASAEVQAQIDALTAEAMASEATQALIDAQVQTQMASPVVQALIDAEVEKQLENPDNRAQAEEIARAEVRRQVEAAAREQVREAVKAQLSAMTDAQLEAMLEEQLQSETLQATIDAEVANQMQSAAVQQMIDAEVENQMQSAAVQQMIDEECARQMQSAEVQAQISSEIAANRSSAAYLSSVNAALEANGENGEAYQALVTLRESLDDLMSFYDGLIEYTDGVAQAADGVSEARVTVKAMLSDGEESSETISFVSARNGAVKNVQFVMTAPAVEIPEADEAEAVEAKNDSVADKLMNLFH
ncbi:MAG: hypothetical protein ACI4O7_03460 [Aristaeellaceae bacterium]